MLAKRSQRRGRHGGPGSTGAPSFVRLWFVWEEGENLCHDSREQKGQRQHEGDVFAATSCQLNIDHKRQQHADED